MDTDFLPDDGPVAVANLTDSDLSGDPDEDAAKSGQIVVHPGPRDLFVDIDNDEDRRRMHRTLAILQNNGVSIAVLEERVSKSGAPHRHAYLRAERDLTPIERIALQACLGSDRTREALSIVRLWTTERAPTVFFEAPGFKKPDFSSGDEAAK